MSDFAKGINVPANDCISRQAAINRATKEYDFYRGADTVSDKARRNELLNVMCWLGELPSAQPEIIRCKDCKHYEDGWIHCNRVTWWNGADDFCSRAERRTNEIN